MKRVFCLLLTFLMFIGLTCCATKPQEEKENKDPSEITQEDLVTPVEEQEEILDFYGGEVIFRVNTSLTYSVLKPEKFESARGDAMHQRYADVAQKYNCDLQVTEFKGGESPANIQTAWLAGLRFGDFYDDSPAHLYPLWQIGEINPINSVWDDEKIFNGKWGTREILSTITFGGDLLGVKTGYWGVPIPSYDGVLYVNNVILSEFAQPHPFEYEEQGKWNWDTFSDLCVNVTANDGERKTYGAVGNQNFYNAAVYSNGGRFVDKDESGNYYVAIADPKFTQALEWLASMKESEGMNNKGSLNDFAVNKIAAFCVHAVWYGYRIDEAKTWPMATFGEGEYSWTRFPAGPSATEHDLKAGAAVLQDRFVAITNESINEPEDVAVIIDAIFEPLDGENENSWLEQFQRDIFYSNSQYISTSADYSFEHYKTMLENSNMDDTMFIPNTIGNVRSAMSDVVTGKKSVSEAIANVLDQAQTDLIEKLAKD